MPNTLGDDALSIRDATLRAYIGPVPDDLPKTQLSWSLSIDASYNFEYESVTYSEGMRAYFEAFSFPEQFREWTELRGCVIEWSDAYEVGVDDSRPGFYLDSHMDVERGIIRFLERDGCRFRVAWAGTASRYNFSFDTWIEFQGVDVSPHYTDDARPLDVLARHLEPNDFVQEPETFPHQRSVPFKPKLK
jgi:hypothetical protein